MDGAALHKQLEPIETRSKSADSDGSDRFGDIRSGLVGTILVVTKVDSIQLREANNYTTLLLELKRFEEAKSLLRKLLPVARRALGNSHEFTLRMRLHYSLMLYQDPGATLDDLREAVEILEDAERIARRVFGDAHPLTVEIGKSLRTAREVLRVRSDGGRVKFV